MLDDAVTAILEIETNVLGGPGGGVSVSIVEDHEVLVAAISATDKMVNMMEKLVQWVKSLENKLNQQSSTDYGCAEKDQSVTSKENSTSHFGPAETTNEPVNFSKDVLEMFVPRPHSK